MSETESDEVQSNQRYQIEQLQSQLQKSENDHQQLQKAAKNAFQIYKLLRLEEEANLNLQLAESIALKEEDYEFNVDETLLKGLGNISLFS